MRSFFTARLPELVPHLSIELNVTSNSSPGAVLAGAMPPERAAWFDPASVDDLREHRRLIATTPRSGPVGAG